MRYLRYLVKADHRRRGGNDQLKTRQRAAVGGCLATSLPARCTEQRVPFVPPPLCHLLSRQGLGPPPEAGGCP